MRTETEIRAYRDDLAATLALPDGPEMATPEMQKGIEVILYARILMDWVLGDDKAAPMIAAIRGIRDPDPPPPVPRGQRWTPDPVDAAARGFRNGGES